MGNVIPNQDTSTILLPCKSEGVKPGQCRESPLHPSRHCKAPLSSSPHLQPFHQNHTWRNGDQSLENHICGFSLFPLQVYIVSGKRVMMPRPSKQPEAQECLTSSDLAGSQCHQSATRLVHPRWGVLSTGCACPCSLSRSQHLSHLQLGMLDSSLALQEASGADWSGQQRQGQCWEQLGAPGVASVPRHMAWLEAGRYGWHYPVHKDSQRMKSCTAVHTRVFTVILRLLGSLCEHLPIPGCS